MIKVRLLTSRVDSGGLCLNLGQIVELKNSFAEALIAAGQAERVSITAEAMVLTPPESAATRTKRTPARRGRPKKAGKRNGRS